MKKTVIFLILVLLLFLAGCSIAKTEATLPIRENTVDEPTSAPSDTTAETTFPTQASTSETVLETTEPAPTVLHSGIREDGSFDGGTLFIGDSQTFLFVEHFLKANDLIGDAKYAAQCGSQHTAFWNEDIRPTEDSSVYCSFSPEFEGMTFQEAAASLGENATAIYLMWGSNYTPGATAQNYIDIAETLLILCPNATIHLETIPRGNVAYEEVNQQIYDAWAYFQAIGESRVTLVDTFNGIGSSIGNDRVHVTPTGREKWYATLLLHAQTLELEQ